MHFRDAQREDLESIVALLADDILGTTRERNETPLPFQYTDAFEKIHAHPDNRLIVAVDENRSVAGCLQLTITPTLARLGMTRATIEGVRISKNHRGSGLGEKLIKFAIDEARIAGCGLVQLTTDKTRNDAQHFYERLGFEPSHVGMKLHL